MPLVRATGLVEAKHSLVLRKAFEGDSEIDGKLFDQDRGNLASVLCGWRGQTRWFRTFL